MIQPGGCLQASTAGPLREVPDENLIKPHIVSRFPVGEIVKDWVQPTAPISQESEQPTALAHGLRTLQNLTWPKAPCVLQHHVLQQQQMELFVHSVRWARRCKLFFDSV